MAAESPPSAWEKQLDAIIAGAPLACDHCGGAGVWMDEDEACCYQAEQQEANAGGLNWYEYQSRARPSGSARWRCDKCGRVITEPTVAVNRAHTGRKAVDCYRCGATTREDACPVCGAALRSEVRLHAGGTHYATGHAAHARCIRYVEDGNRLRRYLGREI
jgi:hypothetical protein